MNKVKIGVIGSGFQADIHCASCRILGEHGEVVAVASPTPGRARALADRHGISGAYRDYREMLAEPDIEMVTIAAPNHLHAGMVRHAAEAGKHVICEKPLCLTLDEADQMIDICRTKGVLLLYGEELLFTPKYLKAKAMADEGAFGRIHLITQCERHPGPHAAWFRDLHQAGGGVFMDMGCHGVAFCYWFLGRSPVATVYCQMNAQEPAGEDALEDNSLCILEFENGAVGLVENSWTRAGGMDDRIEVYGSRGLTMGDLHMGNALPTYSETGYGYAGEKAPGTKGWSYAVYDELYNYGMPQELAHFARCVRGVDQPITTGEDGRAVLEVLLAGRRMSGIRPSSGSPAD